jgi:hypothetical protein
LLPIVIVRRRVRPRRRSLAIVVVVRHAIQPPANQSLTIDSRRNGVIIAGSISVFTGTSPPGGTSQPFLAV